ncbi:MAG: glycosyltransferase [Bacteroidales bacterium]
MQKRKRYIAIFSVTNCICNDQRVKKMASVASSAGFEVIVIGRYSGDCCKSTSLPFRTARFRMLFKRGFLFYAFFNIRLFIELIFRKGSILVANDLDTLLPNFLVSKFKRLPLIYDSHEYFTGVPELEGRPVVKKVWKTIEKSVFPKLRNVITVSDGIGLLYKDEYGITPVIVRNCSPSIAIENKLSREELGVPENDLLLVIQGTGINIHRGAEELVSSLEFIEGATLLVIGGGDVIDRLREIVMVKNLSGKVKFIPKMSWEEMMRYTSAADIGFTLDRSTNINYLYSLPNKLFDYISAGIAIVASDLPEVSNLVQKYKCGIILTEVTSSGIAKAVGTLRENRELLGNCKRNSRSASDEINWEAESDKAMNIYKSLYKKLDTN